MDWSKITVFEVLLLLICCLRVHTQPNTSQENPVDGCLYGSWTEWSACWATCGENVQRHRYRTASVNYDLNQFSFQCDESVHEQQECDNPPCPNDCILSAWSSWSDCNCQINQMERSRSIIRPAAIGGRPCSNHVRDVAACNDSCVQDCQLGDWSEWSHCSVSCGHGISLRQRPVLTAAINGGAPCAPRGQIINCNMTACPPGKGANVCENVTGYLSDPAKACSQYYISCVSNKVIWLLCPDGLRFQIQNSMCDYPENIAQCIQSLNGASDHRVTVFGLTAAMTLVLLRIFF